MKRIRPLGRGDVIANLSISLLFVGVGIFLWADAASSSPILGKGFYETVHFGYAGTFIGKLIVVLGGLWFASGVRSAWKFVSTREKRRAVGVLTRPRREPRSTREFLDSLRRAAKDVWFLTAVIAVATNVALMFLGSDLILGLISIAWGLVLLDRFRVRNRDIVDRIALCYIALNSFVRLALLLSRSRGLPAIVVDGLILGYILLLVFSLLRSAKKPAGP